MRFGSKTYMMIFNKIDSTRGSFTATMRRLNRSEKFEYQSEMRDCAFFF